MGKKERETKAAKTDMDVLYADLTGRRGTFSKPVPLKDLLKVIVDIWETEGYD